MQLSNKGFSLIELLIVITLMGLALALVGPMTIDFIDKSKARNERLKLNRWVKKQSFNHFIQNKSSTYYFNGKTVYFKGDSLSSDSDTSNIIITFEYLFFKPQYVHFNQHGFTSSKYLTFNSNTQMMQLDLLALTESNNAH